MPDHRPIASIAVALLLPALLVPAPARADNTIGLFLNAPGAFDGYTLFEGFQWTDTYLINNEGLLCHMWQNDYDPGAMSYLLENGHLLRCANPGSPWFQQPGGSGTVEDWDWDGNLLWRFTYADSLPRHHHDLEALPDGNVLLIAWELKTSAEAIAAGRNPALLPHGELWPEHIVEVQPVLPDSGVIVWEWHAWDHMIQDYDSTKANWGVVEDHPELIDINFVNGGTGGRDMFHANSIAYNADLDQIVISLNSWSEVWIIDHGTTTAEAAGHTGGLRGMGGDLLWRWGNPQAYRRGGAAERRLYRQHDAHWIGAGLAGEGHLLIFNNGWQRPEGQYSSADEVQTPVDSTGAYPQPSPGMPHGPADALWTYTATPPESLFAAAMGGVQRLPNGNTLICESTPSGTFHEIDPSDTEVWLYVNPVGGDGPLVQGQPPTGNAAFRVRRYASDYPGFDGRDLTPGGVIELPPGTGVGMPLAASGFSLRQNFPNPVRPSTTIGFSLREAGRVSLEVFDVGGRRVATLVDERLGSGEHRCSWSADGVASGVYTYRLRVGAESVARKMTVVR